MISTLLVKTIRFVYRHPVICVVGLIAVIGVIVAISSGSSSAPTIQNRPLGKDTPADQKPGHTGQGGTVAPTEPQGVTSLTPSQQHKFDKQKIHVGGGVPSVKLPADQNPSLPPPDPADTDPTTKAKAIQAQNEEPALQKLPLNEDGVTGDITDESPDGRLVITITYSGSKAHAEKVWESFLARYHDPGTAYLPVFVGG